MLKNKKHIVIAIIASILLVISLITTGIIIYKNKQQNATVETLSKYGSRGSEVTQIQTKLKRWGYYSGNIDGIYGTQTVNAVKYFQRKNGLTADGIAGPATLKAMVRIAECIVKDEKAVLPVSTVFRGAYGLCGLALSVPSVVGKDGVEAVLEIPLSEDELAALHASAQQLKGVIQTLEEKGLCY